MKMLCHPNIVNLVEVIDDPETDNFYMGIIQFLFCAVVQLLQLYECQLTFPPFTKKFSSTWKENGFVRILVPRVFLKKIKHGCTCVI